MVKMFNKKALIEKIKEKGMTLESFAIELGVNSSTLYRKLNGESDFTRAEVQKSKKVLTLTLQEADDIFFSN